jgi:phosphohistidine phosphatase SixA
MAFIHRVIRILRRHVPLWAVLVLLAGFAAKAVPAEPEDLTERMRQDGHVLLLRHALAPGTGDPPDFRLNDCATQRNLSDRGRAQARAIGEWLRARGIERAEIYSSQWCRAMETARLLDLGPVAPLPALNSFFGRPDDRQPNLAALRAFFASQPTKSPLLVMVTHQVTITALTGVFPSSGEGVLLRLGEGGTLTTVDRVAFAEE